MKFDPRPLVPVNPEGLDQVAEALLKEQEPPSPQSTGSSLEDKTSFWTIPGVEYRNGIYAVDLLKSLLDKGTSRTQDKWSEYSRDAIAKKQFRVGDFPLYHALFTALFRNREGSDKAEIKNVRAFLKENFFKYWLMTLTRLAYHSSGKDRVTHNLGLPDKQEVLEDMVGPDEFVKDTKNKKPYTALLGTDNLAEIQAVYNWITRKNAYLWRVNVKPESNEERVAGFNARSGRVFLICGRDPAYSSPALGVRVAHSS